MQMLQEESVLGGFIYFATISVCGLGFNTENPDDGRGGPDSNTALSYWPLITEAVMGR